MLVVSRNTVFLPQRRELRLDVVIRMLLFGIVAVFVRQLDAQQIPALTVCEALHDLTGYSGKVVIVVGRAFSAFEGSFLNEECGQDGKTTVQGQAWLSTIAIGRGESGDEIVVPWDLDALKQKLRVVQQTTHLQSPRSGPFSDRWTAVCGRLEALGKLQAPWKSGMQSHPGNGYGANGSVPARLHLIREYDFPGSVPEVAIRWVSKELEGDWEGALPAGGAAVTFHFRDRPGRTPEATATSADLPGKTRGFTRVLQFGRDVELTIFTFGASYKGTIDAAGTEMVGTWTQNSGATPLPLTMRKR